MIAPGTRDSPRDLAGTLMKDLADVLDLAIPADEKARARDEQSLAAHLARVGRSNIEDLCSWILVECLERHRAGVLVDWAEVLRAADRIRHRMARRQARERPLPLACEGREDETLARSALTIDLKTMLASLPWEDLFILESRLAGGTLAEIAAGIGKSTSYVHQHIVQLRERLNFDLE